MCLDPSLIPEIGFVACRKCWQCCERKVDDWVGRNIAESKTATAAHVVTLTYGEDLSMGGTDHIRAAVLTYSDVQKFLKHLRVDGYPVRYFVVGEYGSTKGRAHWHIILYWQDAVPDHVLRENFMWKYWPHGWSYFDGMSPQAVRYACKYILKDMGDDFRQSFGPMPSKKPPLGDAYLKTLAKRYADAGLSPQDLCYSFAEVIGRDRKPKRFRLGGVSAENLVRYYCEAVSGRAMPRPVADRHEYEAAMWSWFCALRYPNSELVDDWVEHVMQPVISAERSRELFTDMERDAPKRDAAARRHLFEIWEENEREKDVEEAEARRRANNERVKRSGWWSWAESVRQDELDGSCVLEPAERGDCVSPRLPQDPG